MGLFADTVNAMQNQSSVNEKAVIEIQKAIKDGGVAEEQANIYTETAKRLTAKAERTGIKVNQLHSDLQKAFKKYGCELVAGKADIDLKDLYGVEYAGVAIEKFGQLIVYGDAIEGDGAEED